MKDIQWEDVMNIVLEDKDGNYAEISMYDPEIGLTIQDPVTKKYRLCVINPGSPKWKECYRKAYEIDNGRIIKEALSMFLRKEIYSTDIILKRAKVAKNNIGDNPSSKHCPFS